VIPSIRSASNDEQKTMAADRDAQETPATAPQHVFLDDLELRPPLPTEGAYVSPHNRSLLHSLLCRMFCAANVLKLSNEARFSSLVLLHRYFDATCGLSDAQETEEWKWIAAACLFLGTKTEEESRRLRDILNVAHMLDFGAQCKDNTDSSLALIHVKDKPLLLDEDYWSAKEQLVATEQKVLRMLQFDVCVSHPHRAVAVLLSTNEFDSQNKQELLPLCWQYLNQGLFYAPALRHDVLTLACAAIECAQMNLTDEKPLQGRQHNQMWLKYGVNDDALQQCILELEQSVS
jgi:hypothetical protein